MPRFLISRLSALGDTVCSLPVAVALKRSFPDCHITWAVDSRFAGIVECCDAVDEVMRVKPGPNPKTWPTYPHRFDAALDVQGLLKSALCIARARADRKLGFHWQREGANFFSQRVHPDPTSLHVVDQYVDVARAAGAEMHRAEFGLRPKEEDVLAVRRKLKERGVVGRFVAVNAGSAQAAKRWPPRHFAALVDRIQGSGLPVVLLGSRAPADRQVADEVLEACRERPADLLGETSVRELVALVRLASAHVGGDTGSTHLAAALDLPAIGIYSTTRPTRLCPYGQIDRVHFDPEGLDRITPEAVYASLEEALA
jgi:heptosyltransferase I